MLKFSNSFVFVILCFFGTLQASIFQIQKLPATEHYKLLNCENEPLSKSQAHNTTKWIPQKEYSMEKSDFSGKKSPLLQFI